MDAAEWDSQRISSGKIRLKWVILRYLIDAITVFRNNLNWIKSGIFRPNYARAIGNESNFETRIQSTVVFGGFVCAIKCWMFGPHFTGGPHTVDWISPTRIIRCICWLVAVPTFALSSRAQIKSTVHWTVSSEQGAHTVRHGNRISHNFR